MLIVKVSAQAERGRGFVWKVFTGFKYIRHISYGFKSIFGRRQAKFSPRASGGERTNRGLGKKIRVKRKSFGREWDFSGIGVYLFLSQGLHLFRLALPVVFHDHHGGVDFAHRQVCGCWENDKLPCKIRPGWDGTLSRGGGWEWVTRHIDHRENSQQHAKTCQQFGTSLFHASLWLETPELWNQKLNVVRYTFHRPRHFHLNYWGEFRVVCSVVTNVVIQTKTKTKKRRTYTCILLLSSPFHSRNKKPFLLGLYCIITYRHTNILKCLCLFISLVKLCDVGRTLVPLSKHSLWSLGWNRLDRNVWYNITTLYSY